MDTNYNAAPRACIPDCGVAHISADSSAGAGKGYDRNWPAGWACTSADGGPERRVRAAGAGTGHAHRPVPAPEN